MFFSNKIDEKKQYDPSGFRDSILEGLEAAGDDLDAVSKFLDSAGSKLDYRRYGVNLIEILIAGGLLGMSSSTIHVQCHSLKDIKFLPRSSE